MSPHKKARLAFLSALALLLICGFIAGLTITRLIDSARWVAHTYEVKLAVGEVASDLSALGRARTGYILSGKGAYVADFQAAKVKVPIDLQNVRDLTQDNPEERRNCDALQNLVDQRTEILDASMALLEHGPSDDNVQTEYSRQLSTIAASYNGIMQRMQQDEQSLLDERVKISGNLFVAVVGLLFVFFALAIALLWMHYRFLASEVIEREKAETNAKNSEEASHRLSARILQLQDEERRRFSRELHDSLGQSLTVAKMLAESAAQQNPRDAILRQLVGTLEESLSETRTISHLLHPPLLEELGLASAVRWYVEGFTKRGGAPSLLDIPDDFPRLPRPTELVFFRALQESLTNIHRHSKCTEAHVSLTRSANDVSLRVKDNGRGIPREVLERFQSSGTHVGIGLAGMRERVREQGGKFTIQSDDTGTTVFVTLPVSSPTIADSPTFRNDRLSI
jgi:signal transduction histidine kinase